MIPPVREPHEPHLARLAGDDERALDVVEQTDALGIERVHAHEILARQEFDRGSVNANAKRSLAVFRGATPSMSVATPYTGVPSARTMPISTTGARPSGE